MDFDFIRKRRRDLQKNVHLDVLATQNSDKSTEINVAFDKLKDLRNNPDTQTEIISAILLSSYNRKPYSNFMGIDADAGATYALLFTIGAVGSVAATKKRKRS